MEIAVPLLVMVVLLVGWALLNRPIHNYQLTPEWRQTTEAMERMARTIGDEMVPAFQAVIPAAAATAAAFRELADAWADA